MISILIIAFHIICINQIPIIILHPIGLGFLIFRVKYCLTEILEHPEGGTPVLNVMAIRDQRLANVSKQRTLLADVDVAPPHVTGMTGKCELQQECLFHLRRLQ